MTSPNPLSPSVSDLLAGPSSVTTVGVSLFAEALADQAVATHPVDWRPPPVGTEARPGRGARRPAARGGEPHRHGAGAGLRRRAGRRAPGVRGARARPRHLPARRPAHRLGPRVRTAARGAGRGDAAGGPGRRRGRGRAAARGGRAARRLGDHARPVPPPLGGRPDGGGRQPVDVGVRAARPARTAAPPSARSTRASARCCGTAPTGRRWSSGCAGCRRCSGRCCSRRCGGGPAPRRGRSTSARSSRRCCRWATRATTATAPGR